MTTQIKFMWNGIKVNGKLYLASYSDGELLNFPKGTITIYGKHYKHLPRIAGLEVNNGSDMQSDYFENDRIRVTPDNPFYWRVEMALKAQTEHRSKMSKRREHKFAEKANV